MSKQLTIAGRVLRVAAASGIALVALAPATAGADSHCYPNECEVDPAGTPKDPEVLGKTAARAATLPFTGGDATGLALIGAGAVAAGVVFVRQSRRRVNA